jgi:hypothetical protein
VSHMVLERKIAGQNGADQNGAGQNRAESRDLGQTTTPATNPLENISFNKGDITSLRAEFLKETAPSSALNQSEQIRLTAGQTLSELTGSPYLTGLVVAPGTLEVISEEGDKAMVFNGKLPFPVGTLVLPEQTLSSEPLVLKCKETDLV